MAHIDWHMIDAEQLSPSIRRKCVHQPGMTIARIELKKGAAVPMHHHINLQLTNVIEGALRFIYKDGRQVLVSAGEALFLLPNEPHAAQCEEDCVVIDVFTPERSDWVAGQDAYLRGK